MEQKETNSNASYLTEGLAATDKVKAVGWFCRGAPSLMFDEILNATLSEKLSITGVTQENLELPLPPISLDSHQTQNKMKFWTDPRFYSHEGELTYQVDKTKNVWLIVGQLPIKAEWWDAPLALQEFSRSNKQNYTFF